MSIGSRIRARRLELGLSQRELADRLGYGSRSAVANIESGRSELLASRLVSVARALDTSVESLLTDLAPSGDLSLDLHANKGSRNAAIILAGGRSTRNLQNVPNQFVSVLGRPVVSWCLETYQQHPMIDDIVVVCLEGWEEVVTAYAVQSGVSKLRSVVRAGETGMMSVKGGFSRLEEMGYHDGDMVVVQESTRPLVTAEMISRVLLACSRLGSATTCTSMSDSVQFVRNGSGGWLYVDRDSIVDLQSPDAFAFETLESVLGEAERLGRPMLQNSCAMLLDTLGHPLNFCECSTTNMKIIRQEDLAVFEALVRHRSV